ncbi:hypothetical protein niasHT_000296 [Heterodera trifolii]|uniref:Uncharacterized protein n=1 Tax=Heterodera trifolii TaxID=157864 RepID=A0ABD2LTI0_9BILA
MNYFGLATPIQTNEVTEKQTERAKEIVEMNVGEIAFFLLSVLAHWQLTDAIRVISNGLAPPEIVHSPMDVKPRCLIRAAPLDLVFILDSSGSLRNQFQDEIDVIRRIVRHVTIGDTATRVMLIQFSGVQHLEFDFNKFTHRDELLSALDVLRHVSGITRVGGAFEFAISALENASHGIRPSAVPKIVFLLSDGRTHDFPTDSEMAEKLRKKVSNSDIWAYGTGEYVALAELMKITKNESKIITNKNLDKIEPMFAPWHGVEVCEQRPVCVKGSDKPLDLALLVDSSESINQVFQEQVQFITNRIISNVHVHAEAVRLALITFSGQAFVHFGFNDPKVGNNSAVIRYLNTLRPIKGTTSAHLALASALRLFNDPIQNSLPKRPNATKLVVLFSDGRISEPVENVAEMLRSIGVETMAVSLNHPTNSNERELLAIAGRKEHVFTQKNLQDFEKSFLKFVGFGCDGFELGVNATPRIRGATDITCGPDSVTLTVRTTKPMQGMIYAQRFHDDPQCVLRSNGANRENSLTFRVGQCGVQKTPIRNSAESGYVFNVTVILQFHPIIVTRADQGLDLSCVHHQPVSEREFELTSQQSLVTSRCSYRLHRFGPDNCIALDAKVGESLFHKWECETGDEHRFLVHDCYATSERNNVQILDENGCEIDPHFIETPDYSQMLLMEGNESGAKHETQNIFVSQGMAAFKFPDDDKLVFRCLISLCDLSSSDECAQMIPPKCDSKRPMASAGGEGTSHFVGRNISLFGFDETDTEGPKKRQRRRRDVGTRKGFARTVAVETRTLNVIESEGIRPPTAEALRYCDVRN